MKLNKTLPALALALGCATAAEAQNTVYLTGSTAFRAQVFFALSDMGLAVQGGATTGNNVFTFTGSVNAFLPSPSNSIPLASHGQGTTTVLCSFTGSSEAINSLGNLVSPSYSNYVGTAGPVTYANGGDLGLCDVQASSTPYQTTTIAVNEIVSTDGGNSSFGAGVAVVPFAWCASADANNKINNITPYIINDIYANGTEALSFFTGALGDAGTTVFATGRTNDSGTRITALLDVGYNTSDTVVQYTINGNTGTPVAGGTFQPQTGGTVQTPAHDNGYVSGGNVAKALNVTGAGAAVSYLGWPDCGSLLNNAKPILYQGENPSTVALSSWTVTSPWNFAGVENGSYTYWSYEHLYESSRVASGSFIDGDFGPDLVNALEFEIHNPKAGQIQTALTIGDLNVHRNADGGDVLVGN